MARSVSMTVTRLHLPALLKMLGSRHSMLQPLETLNLLWCSNWQQCGQPKQIKHLPREYARAEALFLPVCFVVESRISPSFIILILGVWPITFHSSALCSTRVEEVAFMPPNGITEPRRLTQHSDH
jgi:hypothetical protein